eukprot:jgi/Mesen1/6775/ME000348S06058
MLSQAGCFLLLPEFDRSLTPSTMFHLHAGYSISLLSLLIPARFSSREGHLAGDTWLVSVLKIVEPFRALASMI